MKIVGCLLLLGLLFLSQSKWTNAHTLNGEPLKQLQDAAKVELLNNLNKLANQNVANALRADLNTDDDSKRTLTSIDATSINQIFSIYGLKDPGCDKNKDGNVDGDELECLSKIRKNFVPK